MISLCIPTYERTDLLWQSFEKVLNDDRISEIVIVDDCSSMQTWDKLVQMCNHQKIKLYRNDKNLDCYRNKREAVSKASNEWVILLDSDNVIDVDYLDNTSFPKDEKCIFQPSFAKPHFDFRQFNEFNISKENVASINDSTFQTMLNACNYVVNRDEYLKVWDGSVDPVTSDSIYFMLKWFEAGNYMYVVPGLEYYHRVHDGSHYRNNVRRTPRGFHDQVLNKLKNLR